MTKPYRLHETPGNASLILRSALGQPGQPCDSVLSDRLATPLRWLGLGGRPGLRALRAGLGPRAWVAAPCAAEAMGQKTFTAAEHPNPPKGSAI